MIYDGRIFIDGYGPYLHPGIFRDRQSTILLSSPVFTDVCNFKNFSPQCAGELERTVNETKPQINCVVRHRVIDNKTNAD